MDLLDAMRSNPQANWTIHDIEVLCRAFGVRANPPTGGGSHYKVSFPGKIEILTIRAKRPIKPVYIRALVRYIEAVVVLKSGRPRS